MFALMLTPRLLLNTLGGVERQLEYTVNGQCGGIGIAWCSVSCPDMVEGELVVYFYLERFMLRTALYSSSSRSSLSHKRGFASQSASLSLKLCVEHVAVLARDSWGQSARCGALGSFDETGVKSSDDLGDSLTSLLLSLKNRESSEAIVPRVF